MKYPKTLRIGMQDYDIFLTKTMADRGLFHSGKREIVVNTSFNNYENLDTLLHEILHAIWYQMQLEDGDDEERTVGTIAHGLTQIFRDNPKLIKTIEELAK